VLLLAGGAATVVLSNRGSRVVATPQAEAAPPVTAATQSLPTSIWAVSVTATGWPITSQALATRLRLKGMNAVVAPNWASVATGRAFARRSPGTMVLRPRSNSRCRTGRAICVVRAKSPRAAGAIGLLRGVDLVVVRIKTTADLRQIGISKLRARVIVEIALPQSGTLNQDILDLIRRAAGHRKLELSVLASGSHANASLVRFFDAVAGAGGGSGGAPGGGGGSGGRGGTGVGGGSTAPAPGGWNPGPLPPLNLPSATVFISPTGSDAAGCTQAAPCLSFDRAYRVAQPGQVVELAGGTYSGQTINPDASKTSSDDVWFRPAAGASVTVSGELRIAGAKHIAFLGMSVFDWYVAQDSDDVTFRNIHATYTFITGAGSNINVIGGDIGPYNVCAGASGCPSAAMAITPKDGNASTRPNHILIDGVNFHDITRDPGQHAQTMALWSADDVIIRNSNFKTCPVFCIFVANLVQATPSQRVTIDNSTFDPGTDTSYSVSAIYYYAYGLNITNNKFINAGMGPGDTTLYPSKSVYIAGNSGSLRQCPKFSWITYGANSWDGGAKCP
jgi:hypothetical protein